MNIKLDENLPTSLALSLADLGHDVDTVAQEGLAGYDDAHVWFATQKAERFLITQDLDFSDTRKFSPGTHCGILVVRTREPGRKALVARVTELFQNEEPEQWSGCFVVLTDHKLRVVRPKT